jgi:hypothetical protein
MKKYLMTGIAAIAMCAAFTSCSKDVEQVSQEDLNNLEAEQIVNAYNQAFIKTFGQPAANQDWGFGTSTRGITRGGSEPNQTVWPNYGYPQKPGSLKTTTPSGKSEEEIVTEWFQTHTIADAVTLDCNDYWVLQVHYKNYNYTANQHEWEKYENGKEVWKTGTQQINPIGHMDQIYANTDANGTSSDHIYNFNTNSGSFMLVLDSETKYGFGYEESWGTDNKHVYGNSFMAHIVDEANGIDGYYVGFDYQAYKLENVQYTNNNGETITYTNNKAWALEPDGVYDDRIIKIVPGKDKAPDYDVRIIAEDLNAKAEDGDIENSDWDFNDVVFDVNFTDDNNAEVTLIAAGGTLPLIVGKANPVDGVSYPDFEVHSLFGVDVKYMVNTNAEKKGLNGGAPQIAAPKLYLNIPGVKASNGKLIPIYVEKTLKSGTKKWFELTAEKGHPASKLAINSKSTKFTICDEREKITKKYPSFLNWVVNNDPLIWWE